MNRKIENIVFDFQSTIIQIQKIKEEVVGCKIRWILEPVYVVLQCVTRKQVSQYSSMLLSNKVMCALFLMIFIGNM